MVETSSETRSSTSTHTAPTSHRERFLEAVLASATDYAIIAMDIHGCINNWNEGACRIFGWTEDEMVGERAATFFTADDRRTGIPDREMAAALDTGRGIDERWHVRKDGSLFWAHGEMMPLRDVDGLHIGFIKILRDRTEQRNAAEKHRADAEFLLGVLASSPDCIKVLDLDGSLAFMSEGGQRVMEVSDFNLILGCPWPDFWHGDGNAAAVAALAKARKGEVANFIGTADTMAGTTKWWDVTVSPIRGQDGTTERLLCVSRDVTAAKQAEEHTRLLADELQHRVKNTLAMVQAMIRQTLRTSPSMKVAQESLDQRLAAMGRAHGMLTAEGTSSSELHSIVAASLDLHGNDPTRFTVEGPRAYLQSKAATSFALLLHELGTNATKYGALSVPEGQVRISWTLAPAPDEPRDIQRLNLVWQESGGPPVSPPARRGFGSRLIEQALASALKGAAVIKFLNEGVVCTVTGLVETLPA